MLIKICFILFFSLISQAQKLGFQKGNTHWGYTIYGEVIVNCRSATSYNLLETVEYKCEDSALKPVSLDYFTGPNGTGANEVELRVTQEDQTIRIRKQSYNSSNGLSDSRFNLWMGSLLQKPLLAFGQNQVDYKLIKNGLVLQSGRFTSEVKYGGPLVCRPQIINSDNIDDCRQPYSVCQRYFADNNYCMN